MRAHPRSRGENASFCGRRRLSRGSSPLTRGKPCSMCRRASSVGLIPAHAGKTARQGPGSLSPRAHPRSRGENTTTAAHPASTGGSSPLTRGKPALTAFAPATPRLIPAHAGKTPPAHGQQTDATAHPRSRGENGRPRGIRLVARGSSPLTRGKPSTPDAPRVRVGLIPAHAGKTPNTRPSTHSTRAHPRSRGENAANIDCVKAEDGSSPLTRGKRAGRAAGSTASGLIPAHAGKTRWTVRRGGCRRAHPRSRGENTRLRRTPLGRSGSSPLTRGKPAHGGDQCPSQRLIPAHAGKTISEHANSDPAQAHPRSRGENAGSMSARNQSMGSSPLTRGKLARVSRTNSGRGLIPAHAGKTCVDWAVACSSGAHPRSRGENYPAPCWRGGIAGSSPLTRGKRIRKAAPLPRKRLIPAHAGKTHSAPRLRRPGWAHPRSRGENWPESHPL